MDQDPFGDDFDIFGDASAPVRTEEKTKYESNDTSRLPVAKKSKLTHTVKSDTLTEASAAPTVRNTSTVPVASTEAINGEVDTFAGYAEQYLDGDGKLPTSQNGEKVCAWQVAYPPGSSGPDDPTFQTAPPAREPAKTYPFVLDPFQQRAIESIEMNRSVLVSAHTSAGKTVVAEYAIALSLKLGQRVIYTSPIKALSNQKYRELQEEFTDVGLMTGDVTINPSASCLVMTTEILRNMLFRGSEVMREVAWVVFDEIHYMRDRSRGVVWEETIIMLPHKCKLVFLSATIPNAAEFALWVAKVHSQPCSVVYTDFRPTPLEHHIFPQGGKGLYLVYDKQAQFRDNNFQRALAVIQEGASEASKGEAKDKKKKDNGKDDVFKIVKMVTEKQLQPCIVFSFSKRDCEDHAATMAKLDLCSDDERELIAQIFHNAIDALCDDDKKLPQVVNMYPLLKRGIGVHHGGLLPILKEVIEILFGEGLLKVLFATETFAMGLNMPARTVVFTSVFKYDGLSNRALSSGEYIQMSGRAGRRGLDDKGMVIMMMDQKLEAPVAREMITGAADPMLSSFYLSYNMLLNLLRVEEADPEFLMARSFFQFQQQRAVPHIQLAMNALAIQHAQMTAEIDSWGRSEPSTAVVLGKPHIASIKAPEAMQYMALQREFAELKYKLRQVTNKPDILQPLLTAGRLIRVRGVARALPAAANGSPISQTQQVKFDNIRVEHGVSALSLSAEAAQSLTQLQAHPAMNRNPIQQSASSTAQVINSSHTDDDARAVAPPGLGEKTVTLASEMDWGWGVITNVTKKTVPAYCIHGAYTPLHPHSTSKNAVTLSALVIDVLMPVRNKEAVMPGYGFGPLTLPFAQDSGEKPEYVIVPVLLSAVDGLTKVCLKSNKASDDAARVTVGLNLAQVLKRFNPANAKPDAPKPSPEDAVWVQDGLTLLKPLEELRMSGETLSALVARLTTTNAKMMSHAVAAHPQRAYIISTLAHREHVAGYQAWLEGRLRDMSQDASLRTTLRGMKRVLRALGHTDANDVITAKGRVACELTTCDELVGAELLYSAAFRDLSVAQICALCSCLVFDDPHDDAKPKLSEELETAHTQLLEIAKHIGKVVTDCRLPLDVNKFVDSFNPFMMEAVASWVDGAKFSDICSMTEVYEGTIIRVLRRLEELLRQFANAAAAVGNEELKNRFLECIEKLKRDIVFAASLYL